MIVITTDSYEQEFSSAFKIVTINKKVKEFPNKFDLNSPLNSFITLQYIYIDGKYKLLRSVNTIKNRSIFPDSSQDDIKIADETKVRYLNVTINEVIFYKDSIAFVISENEDEDHQSYFSIRSFYLEAAFWVTSGESTSLSIEESHQFINERADLFFEDFKSILNEFYINN
jgi:hypothetical protein